MLSTVALSCIIAQTIVAIYLFNTLRANDDFEKTLNAILGALLFHMGIKLFMLVVLQSKFLYNQNATGFSLSYGPLLYIITLMQIRRWPTKSMIMMHMLPFCICTLLYFMECTRHILAPSAAHSIIRYASWYHFAVAVSLIAYPTTVLILLKKQPAAPEPEAEKEWQDSRARLLASMAYILLTGISLGLLVTIVRISRTGRYDLDLRLLPYLSFVLLPVMILRYKLQSATRPVLQHSEPQPLEISRQQQYKTSVLDEQMMDKYEVLLKKFMKDSKIYLKAEISLEELSAKIKIPKHHLTQLLNKKLDKNFYSFINEYRITEAIERLNDLRNDISILSLAYDCGFNSKSSFNNYFKKVTNLTPSAYRKACLLKHSEEGQVRDNSLVTI